MADARQILLDKVLAYAAIRGISDVGTSHRLLIYHFGSQAVIQF